MAAVTPVIVAVFPVAVMFSMFAMAFFAEIGALTVIGLGARLGLRHVFADGRSCGTPSTCTHNRAIFTTYGLADRRTSGATYRSTHNGTILARTFGGDGATDRPPHCAADDRTAFTAHGLADCCTGSGTHTAAQNSAEVIRMGTRQHQKAEG